MGCRPSEPIQLGPRRSVAKPPAPPLSPSSSAPLNGVTSSWTGSGLGFSGEAELGVEEGLTEALEVEAETSILRAAAGWWCPEGWLKGKGRRLRSPAGGDVEEEGGEEERQRRGGPGPGEEGGDLRGRRGKAQGRPRRVMISRSVSMGEPLTDHSVMPI